MGEYKVIFTRSARKDLQRLPAPVVARVLVAIERLGSNPRPAAARKLRGSHDLWRLRVGEYRAVYVVDDVERLIDIRVVRHRKDAYR